MMGYPHLICLVIIYFMFVRFHKPIFDIFANLVNLYPPKQLSIDCADFFAVAHYTYRNKNDLEKYRVHRAVRKENRLAPHSASLERTKSGAIARHNAITQKP